MLQGKQSRFQLPMEDFLYVTITGKGQMNATPSRTRQSPFVDLLLELIATDAEGAYTIRRVRIDPKDIEGCFTQVKEPIKVDETKIGKADNVLTSAHQPTKSYNTITSTTPTTSKRVTLRFLKAMPAIIGVDTKTYGPFMEEDVGSLPFLDAKIIVKIGLAALIEENAPSASIENSLEKELTALVADNNPTVKQTIEQPCPRCGSTLVWRTARKTGELYRGCTNFPACHYNERSY
ncbi:MAG: hypothetical protein GX638_06400 [Crenarchaeota archaeon]|nr:hypothetical protein [Thermoproteota archaeon]